MEALSRRLQIFRLLNIVAVIIIRSMIEWKSKEISTLKLLFFVTLDFW